MLTKIIAVGLTFTLFASVSLSLAKEVAIPQKWKGIILYAPAPEPQTQPEAEKYRGLQGVYRLTINQKTGAVDEVGVLLSTGYKWFEASAVFALSKWKFRPGSLKYFEVPILFWRGGAKVNLEKAGWKNAMAAPVALPVLQCSGNA